jgi:hypothetical protein
MLACATAVAGCMTERICTEVAYFCNRTNITMQSTGNAWALGSYTLDVTADGVATTCTVQMPTSAPPDGAPGDCGPGSNVSFSVLPVTSCPPPVCNGNACEQMACTPVAGQFQLAVTIQSLPSHVALSLSVGGKSLVNDMLTPQAATTEPNGKGCGTCTNASATVSTSGM